MLPYQYQPSTALQAEAEKAQAGREYVIRCQRIGDDYRGSLDCIKILTPVERGPIRAIDDGAAEEEVIYIDGVPVATFVTWYGSGGSSWKRAAQVIRPLGKTRIEWEWPED